MPGFWRTAAATRKVFARFGIARGATDSVYRDVVLATPYGISDHPDAERPLWHSAIQVNADAVNIAGAMIGKADWVANENAPDLAIQRISVGTPINPVNTNPCLLFTPENSHDPVAIGTTQTDPVVFPRATGGFNRTWAFGGYNAAINPRGGEVIGIGNVRAHTVWDYDPPLIVPGGTFLAVTATDVLTWLRVAWTYRELDGEGRTIR